MDERKTILEYGHTPAPKPNHPSMFEDLPGIAFGMLAFMGVVSLITYPVAFGSGALLHALTGVDFRLADSIITIAAGPVAFLAFVLTSNLQERGWEDGKIQRKVKKQQRFRKWSEVIPDLHAGNGTLLVELFNFGPTHGIQWRIWWTPENVVESGPERPQIKLSTCKSGEILFVDWCHHRYLDATVGTALLVECPIRPPNEEFIVPEPLDCLAVPFQRIYPNLSVIVLPMVHPRAK